MIQHQAAYIQFLQDIRKQTTGTSTSYVSYLNAVSNQLNIDITKELITSDDAVDILLKDLERTGMEKSYWRNCQSAIRAYHEFVTKRIKFKSIFPEEVDKFIEGAVKKIKVNKYERDPKARAICIAHYTAICQVCKFDFGKKYGGLGQGFIHVHHITPISSLGNNYELYPVNDLIPVCPNCHAMLHMENPPLSVGFLRKILNNIKT